ncbi:MAG: RagB/SusD family nutrient uptake outer membrane protein, partial [Bacteroidales bacterium]|nr:RagB/SusD family nutrient uptake outer membrane protein [Bacteroidales bacterium]
MMNKIIRILACTLFIALVGCADRNEDHLFDRVASDSFYNSPEDFAATVANVYQSLTGISFWYTMVQDNASDAIAIFQHADGWNNGRHHATASHELQASDTRFPIPNIWGVIFDGIAKANLALESLELAEDSDVKTEFIAECKVIRAYYYLLGMDVYGDMPLVTVARIDPQNLPTRKPRSEVFTFVERELLDAIAVLPTGMDENRFPRINREAARAVLATLYLNAEVYTGEGRWSDCITQCDFILGASGYGLAANYFDLFAVNNHQQAQEMIFYIDHDPAENTGGSIGMVRASLTQAWINENYPGFPYTVWNGPAVQPRFYRKYDTADLRYQNGFLEGVQFTQSGDTLRDESGNVVDHKID